MYKTNIRKKAQGMSINVIIVAVIALIVLVVLALIFSGKIKKFGGGTDEVSDSFKNMCEIPGTSRVCVGSTLECTPDKGSEIRGTFSDCQKKGNNYLCCDK